MIQKFGFKQTSLKGAYEITPFYATDERGGFVKDYNIDMFKQNGIDHELKEVFYAISKKGVIRATHFQLVKQQTLYVPKFFGHGYLVLEDSVVSYKCGEVFYGEGDSGIMYNDPEINIEWPYEKIGGIKNLIISEKDKHLMSFFDYKKLF